MDAVLVWEDGEGLEAAIRRGWRRWSGRELPEGDSKEPALAVISPAASRRWELERDLPLVCGVVLLPGEAGDLLTGRLADSAVSYGVSGRDTLTVSSRGEGRLLAALQREVDTLDGQTVEEQEFALPLEPGEDEERALAAAGALLLLGVPPERLEDVLTETDEADTEQERHHKKP